MGLDKIKAHRCSSHRTLSRQPANGAATYPTLKRGASNHCAYGADDRLRKKSYFHANHTKS